jgi:hypothetical protein
MYSVLSWGLDGATGMIESLRIAFRVFLRPGRRTGTAVGQEVGGGRIPLVDGISDTQQEDWRVSRVSR